MINKLIEKIIACFFVLLLRTIEVVFLYDRKKSISERFKEKRLKKIFVIKLIVNEIQIFYIIGWRALKTVWNEHIFPRRFYQFCWDDFKWVVIILSFIKLPKYIMFGYYSWAFKGYILYEGLKFGRETYPWTITGMNVWAGKYIFKSIFIERDSICNNKILKIIYIYFLYNLTNSWVYTSFVRNYLTQLKFVSLDRFVNYNELKWYRQKITYFFFSKYAKYYYYIDMTKLKIGLYERNTKLIENQGLVRNYWLTHNVKEEDEKPNNIIIKEKKKVVKEKIKKKQFDLKAYADNYWKEVEKNNKFNWYKITEKTINNLTKIYNIIKKIVNFIIWLIKTILYYIKYIFF